MTTIYKGVAGRLRLKQEIDEPQGLVTVLANSTSTVDLQNDNMLPGCWGDVCAAINSGAAKSPTVCIGHDWGRIVGRVINLQEIMPGDMANLSPWHIGEGAGALKCTLQFAMNTVAGNDAFTLIRDGYVDEYSVGFTADNSSVGYDTKTGSRTVGRVEKLLEISVVMVGASPGTQSVGAKNRMPTTSINEAYRAGMAKRTAAMRAKGLDYYGHPLARPRTKEVESRIAKRHREAADREVEMALLSLQSLDD